MTDDDTAEGPAPGVGPRSARFPSTGEERRSGQEWQYLADAVYSSVPSQLRYGLDAEDARFLFRKVLLAGHSRVLELTCVPGLVTALTASALRAAHTAGFVTQPVSLTSVDLSGSARLSHPLAEVLEQTVPVQCRRRASPEELWRFEDLHHQSGWDLLLLGSHQRHPSPVLDALRSLDLVAAGGEILVYGSTWSGDRISALGIDYITRRLAASAAVESPSAAGPVGVCSVTVPVDPLTLRDQLLQVLYDHPWEIEPAPGPLRAALGWTAPQEPVRSRGDVSYDAFVERFRNALAHAVPRDSVVLVITKGDDGLLDIGEATAWHFPRRSDGVYAGHHPADDRAAVAHLEALRGKGAQFLAIPAPSLWWLDHYGGLRDHLEASYRLVAADDEIGNLYALFAFGARLRVADSGFDEVEATAMPGSALSSEEEEWRNHARSLFDRDHYERQSGRTFSDADAALDHYLGAGHLRWDPHPLFDTAFYLRRRAHVRRTGAIPLCDFLTNGRSHPLSPSPYFDVEHYAQEAGLDAADGAAALLHYVSSAPSVEMANPNSLFSSRYYFRENPDALRAAVNPLVHWLSGGADSGNPVSQPHKSVLDALSQQRTTELLRGRWAARRILVLASGHRSTRPEEILRFVERIEDQPHTRAMGFWLRRPELVGRTEDCSAVVALEDYEIVCDVMRPTAVRTLVRSLTAQQFTAALTDAPLAVPVLERAGIPTTLLGDGMSWMTRLDLEEVCSGPARVVIRSADTFFDAATRLGVPPTNVVLRPRPRPLASAPRPDLDAELDRYVDQVIDLLAPPAADDVLSGQATGGPPKVVIPCSDWSVSGVNASLEALGRQLASKGWKVEILFTRDRAYVIESAGGEENLPAVPFRFLERRSRTVEGMWAALIADLEGSAPAIVLTSYDFLANGVAPALTERLAVVNWVQSDDGDYYEQAYRLGRYCNAIVSVSNHIKDRISELNPALTDRTHVIHNASVSASDVVKRKSSSREALRLVYAGRLVQYQKRILDFLRLAAALDEREVPYSITLIGEFNPREGISDRFRLKAWAHLADGRIVLPGRLPRPAVLGQLAANDFFLLLSDFEGLPLSLVEAMARGCVPVTAQMASGIPEIVDSGDNGLIIPERDYGKWADILIDCWRDSGEYRRLSMNARRTVLSHFTVEHAASRYDSLFRDIAQQATRGFVRPPSLHWGAEKSRHGDVLPPPNLYRTGNVVGLT